MVSLNQTNSILSGSDGNNFIHSEKGNEVQLSRDRSGASFDGEEE